MSKFDLFHICSVPLATGSVILPGNWGRITRLIGLQNPDPKQLREAQIEDMRRRYFGYFPSRLDAAFAFLTQEEMRNFQSRNAAFSIGIAYRVSLQNPEASSAVGLLSAVSPPKSGGFIIDWAYRYWESVATYDAKTGSIMGEVATHEIDGDHTREIFTLSPLVIEERL